MSLRKWLRGDSVDLNNRWQDSQGGRRLIGIPKLLGIELLVLVLVGVMNETFNLGIGKSPSFVDGSGYISKNEYLTSNVFELKEVTSEFSVGNIVTIGDLKKIRNYRGDRIAKIGVWKFSTYFSYGWCWIRNKDRDKSFSCQMMILQERMRKSERICFKPFSINLI